MGWRDQGDGPIACAYGLQSIEPTWRVVIGRGGIIFADRQYGIADLSSTGNPRVPTIWSLQKFGAGRTLQSDAGGNPEVNKKTRGGRSDWMSSEGMLFLEVSLFRPRPRQRR